MRKALFLVLALSVFISPHLCGEEIDTLFFLREERLDTVDIEGHIVSHAITASMPTQQMSEEEMRSIGAQNVADVLRHFAGTNVKDYGGIGGMKTVSVRGLSASHTGICYDGIMVSNCQAGQVDIGRFPVSNLSGITLSVGQDEDLTASARALASGSLLYLSTKSAKSRWKGEERRTSVESQLKGGSFGYIEPSLFLSHSVSDSLSVNAFVDVASMDGSYPYLLTNGKETTREYRINTDLRSLTAETNMDLSFHRYHTLTAKAYFTQSKRGLPGAVIYYNPYTNERLTDRNAFLQAQYSYWRGQWHVLARAKFNHAYDHYTDTNVKYAGGVQNDINRQNEYYLQGTAVWRPTSSLGIAVAQDEVVNTLSSNLPGCPFPTRFTSFTSLQACYEGSAVKVHGSLLNTFVTEQVRKGARPDDRHKLTPMVSISVRPWSEQSLFLRVMYKETYRLPAFNDLYYFRLGNKNLRPEWAREFNIGLTWNLPVAAPLEALSLTADGFHNHVRDKIVAFPTTYVWKMANYGRVSIDGLDLTLSSATLSLRGWSVATSLTYSLQRAIDRTAEGTASYGRQLPYTPVHSGSGSLRLTTPWCRVGYSVVAASERYSLMDRSVHYRLNGYAEHTLSLARAFRLRTSLLEAQVEALNFTGRQYEIIRFYPMPLQQYRLSLKWKL
jgi:outer membrane cobalamin receptor